MCMWIPINPVVTTRIPDLGLFLQDNTCNITYNEENISNSRHMAMTLKRILITDGEGLVGAYTITAVLELIKPDVDHEYEILSGVHSVDSLNTYIPPSTVVKPVLVDWADTSTWSSAVNNVDAVLLITPFTSEKASQVATWMDFVWGGTHVVHVGVHKSPEDKERPPHEKWFLDAEVAIKERGGKYTLLRLNFDGYNGVLRPGKVTYPLPTKEKFGWMAREDIAEVAARILIDPPGHMGREYTLSAEEISLDDMAVIASGIVGSDVVAEEMDVDAFEDMAIKGGPDDEGYRAYIASVAGMFGGLREGKYGCHKQTFVEEFEELVGRKPVGFGEWLRSVKPGMQERLKVK